MQSPSPANSSAETYRTTDLLRRGALVVLAAAAPFEEIDPPSLWLFNISSVEILILFAFACALTGAIGPRPRWHLHSRITWPAALLVCCFFLSSYFAPLPGEALRQSARLAAGVALFLLAFNNLRSEEWQRRFFLAVFFSGVIVAILAVLEFLEVGFVQPFLRPFKPAPFQVAGWIRASSTLQYPTIASMYLEMVFAFGIGLLIHLVSRQKGLYAAVTFLSLLVVGQALLGTLTRSGPALLFLITAAALAHLWTARGSRRSVVSLSVLLGALALLAAANLGANPGLAMRLQASDQRLWYRAGLTVLSPLSFRVGEERSVLLQAENLGIARWDSEEGFYVSYHWMAADRNVVKEFNGIRTAFPASVAPGQHVRLNARVRAPAEPGEYRLAFDVLREHEFWFSSMGSELAIEPVSVLGTASPSLRGGGVSVPRAVASSTPERALLPDPVFKVDRVSLWKAAAEMLLSYPLLGIGPGSFKYLYGDYLGLEQWDHNTHSNNLYVEVLVSSGIVGAVPFALLIWAVLSLCLRCLRPSREPADGLSLGLSFAVLAFLLHGLVDYFLEFTPIYVMFWLTLGVLAARLEDGKRCV